MFRPLIAVLLSTLVVFGTGELLARWWIGQYGNALDVTRRILVVDPVLGWRQRANLDTAFLETRVVTGEEGLRDGSVSEARSFDGENVLILGPSSAFGWGVESVDTYAKQLQDLLRSSRTALVLNAGQIGYSSHQGLVFGGSLIQEIRPDVVVVAYGVNDLDRNRFYFQSARTDEEELSVPHSRVSVGAQNLVFSNALTSLMYSIAQSLAVSEEPPAQDIVRVPPEHFEYNIRALVSHIHAVGALPILVTTSVNMPQDFAASDEPRRIVEGVGAYNAILRGISADMGVPIADIDALFARHPSRQELFVDPVHFSPEGNRVVAEELFTIISSQHLLSL